MNVVCGQCGTGYEFDDALVSERGTTVRCTQCGFQFRVRPSGEHASGPERWIVRKVTGEEYIFRTLSELQRAIAQRRVAIEDSLSRDGATFRPMRELSELDCFFEQLHHDRGSQPGGAEEIKRAAEARRSPAGAGRAARSEPASVTPTAQMVSPAHVTARKLTPPGGFATAPPEAIPAASHAPSPQMAAHRSPDVHRTPPNVAIAQVRAPRTASRGHDAAAYPEAGSPPPATMSSLDSTLASDPDVIRASRSGTGVSDGDRATPVVQEGLPRRRRGQRYGDWEEGFAAPGGPVDDAALDGVAPTAVAEGDGVVAAGVSSNQPSNSQFRSPVTIPPPERSMGLRWIVGLVLLGGMGLIAGTVGRDYFEQFRAQGVQLPSEQNARVEQYLAQGDELYRAGDLEEARAQFDKASVLAEGSAEVALRLLRIEATRGDVEWLRLRLLRTDAEGRRKTTQARLAERSQKLNHRAREYEQAAGEQATSEGVGALVDALRIQDQTAKARALVERSAGLGADAYAAYVSAMLDVAEPKPAWSSVIARLRQAVSGERGLGRAQAALVYALASSGDIRGAEQQLDVLAGFRRAHPLVDDLRSFIARSSGGAEAADESSQRAEGDQAAQTNGMASTDDKNDDAVSVRSRSGAGQNLQASDPMQAAAEARAAGELARAGRLYTQALSREPGNVAAMTGLGDVARSQGNTDIALSHYGAALRRNPSYAPAVLASADLRWATGDRAGAVELYRRLPPGSPERVARRIAEFTKASSPEPGPTATSSNTEPGVAGAGTSGPAPQLGTGDGPATTPEASEEQSSP